MLFFCRVADRHRTQADFFRDMRIVTAVGKDANAKVKYGKNHSSTLKTKGLDKISIHCDLFIKIV